MTASFPCAWNRDGRGLLLATAASTPALSTPAGFRLLVSLKGELVETVATRLASPAAGELHRDGRGALEKDQAREFVGEAIREGVGPWGPLVDRLWERATLQVVEQCTAVLQVKEGVGEGA